MMAGAVELLDGEGPPTRHDPYGLDASQDTTAYREWLATRNEAPTAGTGPRAGPCISVIVPVFRPPLWCLERCVDSVRRQSYPNWELCLCDDASGDPEITAYLKRAAAKDPRIRWTDHQTNSGISNASNSALALAHGELVALLDHDDELTPDALARVASVAAEHADVDVIYSDEDKLDTAGARCHPQFKPDWCPDLLLSYPYLGHLTVLRSELLRAMGGFRSEVDGSQDYDVMLRATERARGVVHIPEILYHWRIVEGSAAHDPEAKPWAYTASRRALSEALQRRGEGAWVEEDVPFLGGYHTRHKVTSEPRVSIVVPIGPSAPRMRACVDSMSIDAGYDRFEVLVIDGGNSGLDTEISAVVDLLLERPGVRLVQPATAYNWSALRNAAVAQCDGEVILFLDEGLEARSPGWLEAMLEHALRRDVGAVGARILYPDASLCHAGVTLGLGGVAGYLMAGLPEGNPGYLGWSAVAKGVTAVTGSCMMTRRDVFDDNGGFDESYDRAYADIDFCLRLSNAARRVVYTPHAEFTRHAATQIPAEQVDSDRATFLRSWESAIRKGDPLFNPNLSRLDCRCVVRPPDEEDQWQKLLCGLSNLSKA